MSEKYNCFKQSKFRNGLALYKIPIFLDNLFSRTPICFFQHRFSLRMTPRKLILSSLLTLVLLMTRGGKIRGRSSCVDFLQKRMYLVFVIFNDNLLALNHSLINSSSRLAVSNKVLIVK